MKTILENSRRYCDACELFDLDTTTTIVGFDDQRLKFIDVSQERGIAIRLMIQDRLAQGYATDIRRLDALIKATSVNAQYCDPVAFRFSTPSHYPLLDLAKPEVLDYPIEKMIGIGEETVKIVKDYDPDIKTMFSISTTNSDLHVMNTYGVDAGYKKAVASYSLSAQLVQPANIIQLMKGWKGLAWTSDPILMAHEMVEDMSLARKTVDFTTGKFPIIFTPSALGDIFMAFVGAVSGDYVAKGMSPLVGKIGEQILDPRITIWDDPLHPEGTFSMPTDDEGTPGFKKNVIENGILKMWLADRRSAAELGIEPTGNGQRNTAFEKTKSFSAGVHTDFTNMVVQPGDVSYSSMLTDIDKGLEVHYITGILLGNLINGDFSGNLEVAYKIENGMRVGRVKDVMIGGNFFNLFKNNLRNIGDRGYWTGSFGGGSGSMFLPHILLDNVDVSARE